MTHRIEPAQRRARIVARHLLTPPGRVTSAVDVADALVALHATDPATVFLSAAARMTNPDVAAVEQALYADRTLLRLLAMRRTMFTVSSAAAPVVDASTGRTIAAKQRTLLLRHLADGGGWDARWLADVEQDVLEALARRGQATANELAEDVPALREQVVISDGKGGQLAQNVNSRIVRVLAAENRIRRDRPRGGWTSSQFRWSTAPALAELPAAQAKADLVRRWLARYGPGTEPDLAWWTGWTLRDVRAALAAVGAVRVELAEGVGFVVPGDEGPVPATEPWAALLPALDPTPMGWRQRDWYLPVEHRDVLFDRMGNAGPTVWWDGGVVGGWAQRPDGEIVWELLADVGADTVTAIETEAARMAAWVGDARITPRFRTPLERRLSS
ncbi:MAG TPA: winged helix DNA-binding domain-containing protein [Pseudonocardiaceae bacterium]|nr:winged helix DNA-binding domain-containing protein [Pseudonocardiaceae bacterium]